jgi:hypothetical protein
MKWLASVATSAAYLHVAKNVERIFGNYTYIFCPLLVAVNLKQNVTDGDIVTVINGIVWMVSII